VVVVPKIIEYWTDINPGLTLVYGAALGAYLGLNIHADMGVADVPFFMLLMFSLAFSVTNLELGAKRFHQGKLGYSASYFGQSLVGGALATFVSSFLGFNPVVPASILGAWFLTYLLECFVTSPGVRKMKETDV
jgi:hypothetical protein